MKFFETSKQYSLKKSTYINLRWIGIIGQLVSIYLVYFYFNFEFNFFLSNLIIFIGIISNLYLIFIYKKTRFFIIVNVFRMRGPKRGVSGGARNTNYILFPDHTGWGSPPSFDPFHSCHSLHSFHAVQSFIHSSIHPSIHSFIHSFIHSLHLIYNYKK